MLEVRVVINHIGDAYTVVVEEATTPGETVGDAAIDIAVRLATKVGEAPIHRLAVIVSQMGGDECEFTIGEFPDGGRRVKENLVGAVRTMANQATEMLLKLAS